MMPEYEISSCCLRGFEWEGTPTGRIDKLANNQAYVAGNNPKAAVLLIHDLASWSFPNMRLLADHIAREASVTVYLPDFYAGEHLAWEPMMAGRWEEIDVAGFVAKNSREIREPEIFECARALKREKGFSRTGAVGYCFGGWAVFRLGAKEHNPPLVDCISTGHPTFLTEKDIDEVLVPVQVLAPEHDPVYTPELKLHTFQKITTLGVPFDYQHFPGVEHACFSRGDPNKPGERDAMVRGKNAVVAWIRQFLHEQK